MAHHASAVAEDILHCGLIESATLGDDLEVGADGAGQQKCAALGVESFTGHVHGATGQLLQIGERVQQMAHAREQATVILGTIRCARGTERLDHRHECVPLANRIAQTFEDGQSGLEPGFDGIYSRRRVIHCQASEIECDGRALRRAREPLESLERAPCSGSCGFRIGAHDRELGPQYFEVGLNVWADAGLQPLLCESQAFRGGGDLLRAQVNASQQDEHQ